MKLKAIYDTQEEIPEAFRELYTERNGKWELTGVEGVKTQADIDRINTALTNEKAAHKKTKEDLGKFAGLNPDEVHEKLDQFDELKIKAEANNGNIDDAKIQQIVDQKVAREKAPLERKVKTLEEQVTNLTSTNTELSGTITKGKIETALRSAAEKAKVNPTAIEDIVLLGERIFEVAEDGAIVTKADNGATPGLQPEVWIGDMKEKRPHWWPNSQGGGAQGSGNGGGASSDNPWSKAGWNMTKQGAYVREHGNVKAEQMAKAAGSKIGAAHPPEK